MSAPVGDLLSGSRLLLCRPRLARLDLPHLALASREATIGVFRGSDFPSWQGHQKPLHKPFTLVAPSLSKITVTFSKPTASSFMIATVLSGVAPWTISFADV